MNKTDGEIARSKSKLILKPLSAVIERVAGRTVENACEWIDKINGFDVFVLIEE